MPEMTSRRRAWTVLAVLVGLAIARPEALPRQAGCRPLDLTGVLRMLEGGFFSDDAIRRTVSDCGVTFLLDEAGESRVRDAGGSGALVALLRPPADASAGTVWLPLTDRRTVIRVPAGPATLGDESPETPAHEVAVRAFWLDANEVTNEAFARFVAAHGEWARGGGRAQVDADAGYLSHWTGPGTFRPEDAARPVVNVSWHAARAYAAWAGKRLPTEAEWEYAARAGTSSAYWWGDSFEPARVGAGASEGPSTVGSAPSRNPWGFFEMLGNAAEWTSSAYRPYPYSASDGREDSNDTGDRTVRGGAFNNAAVFLRAANRMTMHPTATAFNVGFRCVLNGG